MHIGTAYHESGDGCLFIGTKGCCNVVQHDTGFIKCGFNKFEFVPIFGELGFANGVCSSAIEFQKEGQVFGIGCQIFRIAGPVILYGIFSSWVLGLIYWILKMIGVV